MNKLISTLSVIALLVTTHWFAYRISEEKLKREAILAGLAGYNELLEFQFKTAEHIAVEFINELRANAGQHQEQEDSAPVPAPNSNYNSGKL